MLVDGEYPDDFKGDREGKPKYKDLVIYCAQHNAKVSSSAIGRFGMRMRTLSRMKQAGVISRQVMEGLTDEKASSTQKAVAEMITAITIEFVSSNDDFTTKQIAEVAKAMKDCTAIAIKSDEYTRTRLETKAEEANKKIADIAHKKNSDPETPSNIKAEVYGIFT